MVGKPQGFREEYIAAATKFRERAEDQGLALDDNSLQTALYLWSEDRLAGKGSAKPAPKPRNGTIVPGPGARGGGKSADVNDILKGGRVPDGKGGSRPGNLLGI